MNSVIDAMQEEIRKYHSYNDVLVGLREEFLEVDGELTAVKDPKNLEEVLPDKETVVNRLTRVLDHLTDSIEATEALMMNIIFTYQPRVMIYGDGVDLFKTEMYQNVAEADVSDGRGLTVVSAPLPDKANDAERDFYINVSHSLLLKRIVGLADARGYNMGAIGFTTLHDVYKGKPVRVA